MEHFGPQRLVCQMPSHHSKLGAPAAPGWLDPSPLLSEASLEVDIYRNGQVQVPKDKQAKVRLPARGSRTGTWDPGLAHSPTIFDLDNSLKFICSLGQT